MHMQLQERLGEGVKLRLSSRRSRWELRVPGWVPGVVLLLAGGTLQFFWKEWRPTFEGGQSNVAQPLAREDDYLVVMGLLLLLESLRWLRKAVGNVLFVAIGRRSLSKSSSLVRATFTSVSVANCTNRCISGWKHYTKHFGHCAVYASDTEQRFVVCCCHRRVRRRVSCFYSADDRGVLSTY